MKFPFADNRENWVVALEYLYEKNISIDISDKNTKNTALTHLAKRAELPIEAEIKEEELSDTIEFLNNAGLIEDSSNGFGLTEEGLQLAHQIKTERQRRNTNIILVVLTAVLTILTIGLFALEVLPLL